MKKQSQQVIQVLNNNKMKRYLFLISFFLLQYQFIIAQKKYTLSGYVKDTKTGEELIGATVFTKEPHVLGTTTNAYGFYSITLPEGEYSIIAQYMGYEYK